MGLHLIMFLLLNDRNALAIDTIMRLIPVLLSHSNEISFEMPFIQVIEGFAEVFLFIAI